ncbi:hypothetical protein HBI18_238640 [Parastagonospora nodorum]|nr:hypothetical protein HBI18_238640 [Parastagonospora nodorum]
MAQQLPQGQTDSTDTTRILPSIEEATRQPEPAPAETHVRQGSLEQARQRLREQQALDDAQDSPYTIRSDAKASNESALYGHHVPSVSLPPPSTSAATVWKAGVSDDSTGTERGSLNSLNPKRGIRTINRRAPQAMKPGYRSSPEYGRPTLRPFPTSTHHLFTNLHTPPTRNTGVMKATVVDEQDDLEPVMDKGKGRAAPTSPPLAPVSPSGFKDNSIDSKFAGMQSVLENQRREMSLGVSKMNETLAAMLQELKQSRASPQHPPPPPPAPAAQQSAQLYHQQPRDGLTAASQSASYPAFTTYQPHLTSQDTTAGPHPIAEANQGGSSLQQFPQGTQNGQPAPIPQNASTQAGMYTRFSPRAVTAPPTQQDAQVAAVQTSSAGCATCGTQPPQPIYPGVQQPAPQQQYHGGDARRYSPENAATSGQTAPTLHTGDHRLGSQLNQAGATAPAQFPTSAGYYMQQQTGYSASLPPPGVANAPHSSVPRSTLLPNDPYVVPGQQPHNAPQHQHGTFTFNANGTRTAMGTPQHSYPHPGQAPQQFGQQPQSHQGHPTPAPWTMAQPFVVQDQGIPPAPQFTAPAPQFTTGAAAPGLQDCGDGYMSHIPTAEEIKAECDRAKAMGGGDFRFQPKDIGAFNPALRNVDENGVNVYQGKITYKHVRGFLEAVKAATTILPDYIVRAHLWKCLEGDAHTWFHHQLPAGGKQFVVVGRGLENWTKLLTDKFARPKSEVGAELAAMKFTRADLMAGKSVTAFAVNVARNLQEWGYADPVRDERFWMDHIYSKLDPDFRINVPDPNEDLTIRYDKFIQVLEARAKIWREQQTSRGGYQSQFPRTSYLPGQGTQPARPRPVGGQFNVPGQQNRPSNFNSNASNFAPNTQQQRFQGNAAPQGPAPAQQPAAQRNAQGQFASQSRNYPPRQDNRGAPQMRGGGGRGAPQRTFMVDDHDSPGTQDHQQGDQDPHSAPQEEYDGGDEEDGEDAFYNAPQTQTDLVYHEEDQGFRPLRLPGNEEQIALVNFASQKPSFTGFDAACDVAPLAPRTCGTCAAQFKSNNKLWSHIRSTGHFVSANDDDHGADPSCNSKNSWASNLV